MRHCHRQRVSSPSVVTRPAVRFAVLARSLVVLCALALPGALLAQDVRQVLDMAFPAEGTIARLHVDLLGNPHGGWPVVVGDVNGDGVDDFFWVRWSFEEDTWPDSLLVFGGPHLVGVTGVPLEEAPHALIRHPGRLGALLPSCWRAAAPAGDLDGDGFDDFVVATCSSKDGDIVRAGRAIVVFGQSEWPADAELGTLDAAGIRSLHIVSREDRRMLGLSVNRIGDINDDGLEDLALGARGDGTVVAGDGAGRLYVLFGGFHERDGVDVDEIDVAEVGATVPGVVIYGAIGEGGPLVGDSLGSTYVEGAGDVNGDGIDDLLVPAKGANDAAGAVYVVYGRETFPRDLDASLPDELGVVIWGREYNARLGGSMSGAGDVDGDGLADFIVGQPAGSFAQPGGAYLIYGSSDWPEIVSIGDPELRLLELRPTDPTVGGFPRLFGWWVEGIGDWNEDGFDDVAIGAPWQQVELEKYVGRTYVVYGGPALPASAVDTDVGTSALPGLVLAGHRPVSGFGMAGDVGDVDGDGRRDLLITASTYSELGQDRSPSSVSIFFRSTFDATTFAVEALDPPAEGAATGGDVVRIRGRGFDARASVRFGELDATEVRVVHSALIEAVTPAAAVEGLVDVEVRQGADVGTLADAFRYRRHAYPDLVFDPAALHAAGVRSADVLGLGVSAVAADMNSDGRSDLVIASFVEDVGKAAIVFGRATWPDALDAADVTIHDEPAVAWFANHFDAGGDLDGDGFADLVLGGMDRDAFWHDAPGRTYLLRGRGESWPEEIEIADELDSGRAVWFPGRPCASTKPAFVMLPGGEARVALSHTFCAGRDTVVDVFDTADFESAPEHLTAIHGDPATIGVFGDSLVPVGDMNADGWPDLIAGDKASNAAYLILGDASLLESGETVDVLDLVASGRAVRFTDNAHISEFAAQCAAAGDFNGDGLPDAIVSAEYGGFQLQGRSYVVFGSPALGDTIHELDVAASGETHLRITGEQSGDTAGYCQAIGDINGDGFSDVVVVGSYYDSGTPKAHVVLGERDPPASIDLATLSERGFKILLPDGVKIVGAGTNNGRVAVLRGDFDGDGQSDLAFPFRSEDASGMRVVFGPIIGPGIGAGFVRGDVNTDAAVNISDAQHLLNFLFLGGPAPSCNDAADINDDGAVNIADAQYLLNHLFLGGEAPPAPFPERGLDPSADVLACDAS